MRAAPSSLEGEGVKPFIIDAEEYDERKIIRRKEQQEKLKEFFDNAFAQGKYAFLVGKSGSGKSLLISEYAFYEKNVTRFEAKDYNIQNNLEGELDKIVKEYEKRMTRYIIIFDQFERALINKKVFGYITHFLKEAKNSPISVAFVCMNEDYIRIIEELKSSIINKTEEG
jgi:ABC-type polar amino acid transport system ATPase subunit